MPNHVRRPAIAVMFENQLKTLPDPDLTPMNARNANAVEHNNATYGKPFLVVRMKIFGAFPETARPSMKEVGRTKFDTQIEEHLHKARELVYMSLEAADHAEVRRHALMIYY